MNIIDDISVAQKTVNTRGTKELLSQEYSYNLTPASTNGTSVLTAINNTITLKESIFNYDMINIQLKINRGTVKICYPLYTFKTSNVIFNNSDTLNFSDGSLLNINKIQGTTSSGAWGSSSATFSFWFKDETHMFILNAGSPYTSIDWANVVLSSIEGVNIENTTIDPVEYINTNNGIEDSPVGHILSQMGKVAPKHYLVCDGTVYNIVDYPHLSQYIKDQFGTFNYFGGDGTTTFAVPDLRGEFLRGTGTATRNTGTGASIGGHQNPTFIPWSGTYSTGSSTQFMTYYSKTGAEFSTNSDKTNSTAIARAVVNTTVDTSAGVVGSASSFSSRPTNTAVLYCIKYEPTYFMNLSGVLETTTLWEGSVGTSGTTQVSRSLGLTASVLEYDEIGFYYQASIGSAVRLDYNSFPSDRFKTLIESPLTDIHLSLNWGQSPHVSFSDIEKTSSYSNLNFLMYQSFVTKVVGIKYKTSQSADVSYTNQEITDMVEGVYYGN